MDTLETIEKLVQDIPCPVCLNSRFEVNLSCDLPGSPCDFQAACGHCHYKFIVTTDTQTMEQVWGKVRDQVKGQGCPECGDEDLNLEFLCDVQSEDCFFLLRCAKNGHFCKVDQKGILHLFR